MLRRPMRFKPLARHQAGFGLLVFVLVGSIVALSLVIGYSGVLTRQHANQLGGIQEEHVEASLTRLEAFYRTNSYTIDSSEMSNPVTADDIVRSAGLSLRHEMKVWLSQVLTNPEGLTYRRVVMWIPTHTDEISAPNREQFESTGQFVSCPAGEGVCAERHYRVYSSEALQRELAAETRQRLTRIAYKAQGFFKARLLQDPERNFSINHFRPIGGCPGRASELECFDTYAPLASMDSEGRLIPGKTAELLSLASEELVSAWGIPIELSNLQDSVTDDTPYSLALRALMPNGQFMTLHAVQSL